MFVNQSFFSQQLIALLLKAQIQRTFAIRADLDEVDNEILDNHYRFNSSRYISWNKSTSSVEHLFVNDRKFWLVLLKMFLTHWIFEPKFVIVQFCR